MSVRGHIALAVALALSACGPSQRLPTPGLEILDGDWVSPLLNQCSRDTPKAGEATWQPGPADIAVMEKALPPALKARHPEMDWSAFPTQWSRRYVGIVRGGHRYIYGDYSPRGQSDACDGGPHYFGAEYDVTAGRFSHLAFNGLV